MDLLQMRALTKKVIQYSLSKCKRSLSIVLSLLILGGAIPVSNVTVQAAESSGIAPYASYVSDVPTPQNSAVINPNYDRSYDNYVVTGPTGLVHPGILHSRADLNTMRDMVWLGKEPWASTFDIFRRSPESSKNIAIYGNGGTQKEFTYPHISDSNGDKQLRQDATTAYQQALMWYITGDQVYLNNAKQVLDAWANGLQQFFDTTEPADWDTISQVWGASSVLGSGVAGQKLAAAAEILLYTPSSGWCRDDQGNIDYEKKQVYDNFFRLIWQETNKWFGYFNQAAVGNMGYMSISIFLDDINGYNEAVERFAYNKKAVDAANENGGNSINFSVAAMILDHGQIVEMGRDQPHSALDVSALGAAARTIHVQGTKLDPVTGVPVAEGGVDPYEFQNQKLLKALSYFTKYNAGYDVDFIPNVNGLGQQTEWSAISWAGRGFDTEIASIYNHYKYEKGYSGGIYDELYKYPELMMHNPEGGSIDTPGYGTLLFTPWNAAMDMEPKGPPQPLQETENLYGLYNRHPAVPFSSNNAIWFKNGFVKPGIASYLDENEVVQYKAEGMMNGNWIGYENFDFGSVPADTLAFTYAMNSTAGSIITMYVTEPEVKLTDETMAQTTPTAIFHVPHTGWWTIPHTHVQKFNNIGDTLKGKKNLYFKTTGSNNWYNFAAEPRWFQFSGGFAKTDNKAIEAPITSSSGYVKNEASNNITLTDDGYIGYRNMNFDSGTVQLQLNHKAAGSGTLEMRLGGPQGQLVKSYPIADTAGSTVTAAFDHQDDEILYGKNGGNNDLYLVYKGTGALTFNSFKYVTPSSSGTVQSTKRQGGSYLSDLYGNAERIGDHVVLKGENSAVAYRNANMGSKGDDRRFMVLRVKSNEPVVMKAIDLGYDAAANTVAEFAVPNTNGEFVTIAYDLAKSGYASREGGILLKLQATGGTADGSVEVDYFSFDNADIPFVDLLQDVSIESDHPGNPSIATLGDTITLSFTASEPIDSAAVYFGSTKMDAVSTDARHFTVTQKLGESYTPGRVQFRIDYNQGANFGKSVRSTTDGTTVTIVNEDGLINDVFKMLPLIDSSPGRGMDATIQQAATLFDGDAATVSDFRSDSGGWGSWIAFDLGDQDKVQLTQVKLLASQGAPARAAGVVIQGTNHIGYEPWVTLTDPAVNTVNWQTLTVQNPKAYRYIRIYNGAQWFGNLAEVKFYGTVIHESPVLLDTVTLKSDNSEDSSIAVTGNTVTLDFAAEKALENVRVYFRDELVETVSDDSLHWKARYTVGTAYQTGKVPFVILYDNGPVVTGTTDGTSVTVIDPLQIALDHAANLEAGNYSRLSYYLFSKEVERIKAEMNAPGYSDMKLAKELYDAKSLLAGNPLSIYSFEGNADNAFGSSNGTVSGTPAFKNGIVGKAIELNGTNSYVTLPSTHPLSSYDQITLSTWVYWKGGNAWQRIFDFGNSTTQYMFLTPKSGNNTLRFAIRNGGGEQMVQTASMPENEWVHVAVTLGDNTAKLYVNGELMATNNNVTIKPSDIKPTLNYLGKSQFSDPLLGGMLDEFRIYDHVLSADVILHLANNTAPQGDNSLLVYLLDQAAALDTEAYPEESVEALQAAVTEAQSVYNNADATQEEIDAASATLEAVLDGLQYPWLPVLAPIGDKIVIAEQQLTFTVKEMNGIGVVQYEAAALPEGASFNAETRTFDWTPVKEQGGVHEVVFTVTSGELTTSRTVKITVRVSPVITADPVVELTAKELFTYQVPASDPSGAKLTYSAENLPAGASFNAATGVLSWTPGHADYGSHPVIFTVSNGSLEASQTIVFNVRLNVIPPAGYTQGSYYLYQKEAARIEAEMAKPEADKALLAAELVQAEASLNQVPLSLYSFEGNAENAFGKHDGTAHGNVGYAEGKIGQAVHLNGTNGYMTLPSEHALSGYDEITVATWVNWRGGGNWQRIFDFGNNTNQFMFLTPKSGNNTLRFAIKNGGGEQIVQTAVMPVNEWVHVAVTLGGNTAKLYVNGELMATNSNVTIKPNDFKPGVNYIGKSQFNDPLFNGMIDEFQIYNYVLSTEEIQAVYNNTAKWIDNSLLTVLLEEAGAIDTELFTEESVQALQAQVTNAQSVYDNAEATQEEIDAASASLLSAIEGLQWKDITASLDPAEPTGKNGWYTSPVTVTLTPAAIAEYSLDGGDTWTAYSEPLILVQEGMNQVLYRSVDTAETSSLEVQIDLSAPVVQIMGEASYTIDQTVTVTCSASDVVSSVFGTPCDQPLLQVKAYTLESGEHTVTVSVEDMAGHQTTADHTFTVMVTFDSLKTVTNVFLQETNAKGWNTITKSLNQKLDQAKAAADQGKIDTPQSMMADYIKQVTDQTGKYFTQEQADILIRWAQIVI